MTTQLISIHITTDDPGTIHDASKFVTGLAAQVEDVSMSVHHVDLDDVPEAEPPTCDRSARTAIHRLAMALDEWADLTTSDEVPVVAGLRRLNGRLTELRADLDADGA